MIRNEDVKNFTLVKASTKKGKMLKQGYVDAIGNYGIRPFLYNVYESYSQAKANALAYCRDAYCKYDGWMPTIISFNTFTFTYGFKVTYETNNGNLEDALVVITPNYDYLIA